MFYIFQHSHDNLVWSRRWFSSVKKMSFLAFSRFCQLLQYTLSSNFSRLENNYSSRIFPRPLVFSFIRSSCYRAVQGFPSLGASRGFVTTLHWCCCAFKGSISLSSASSRQEGVGRAERQSFDVQLVSSCRELRAWRPAGGFSLF